MNFLDISKKLTIKISSAEKKNNGIYFTPPNIVSKNMDFLKVYMPNVNNILEPSCGSGEYLSLINQLYPEKKILGIELNKKIFNEIKKPFGKKNKIINADYLKYDFSQKFDLIIGNPPYFVIKKKDFYYDKEFEKFYDGRANIFILFIIKSLNLLEDNGILSFVLPKNFLNCLCYNKTREFINEKFQILEIYDCNEAKYLDTQQETIIFIVQKKNEINNEKFLVNNNFKVFASPENTKKINELLLGSKSLKELDFKVSVGNIVWNQEKPYLTSNPEHVRLIYSSDVKKNKLILSKFKKVKEKNDEGKEIEIENPKKHYFDYQKYLGDKKNLKVDKLKSKDENILVINRGYGNGKYSFNYCIIDLKQDYLIENHLIMLDTHKKMNKKEKIKLYQVIIKSLENEKTKNFIDLYFGNNALNTTELNNILPIYQDI